MQYISDLIAGMTTVMEGPHVGPFNVGNPGEFTMIELANLVKEVSGVHGVVCWLAGLVCHVMRQTHVNDFAVLVRLGMIPGSMADLAATLQQQ